jgi:hypothetical protein
MTVSEAKEDLYQKAVSTYMHSVADNDFVRMQEIFQELGDYKDSEKYLKKCEEFLAHSVGRKITFGAYHKKELVWTVLRTDGPRCLLLADDIVDCIQFSPERDDSTWSTSILRHWLNKQFLEESFTIQERMYILLTSNQNNTDPRWDDENGPDTRDKAFVFNLMELNEYLPNIEDRAIGTWWWLRGHGCSNLNQQAVYADGTVYEGGVSGNSTDVGVRPAMWVRRKR